MSDEKEVQMIDHNPRDDDDDEALLRIENRQLRQQVQELEKEVAVGRKLGAALRVLNETD